MPADNIKNAIMRGTGELEGGQIDEIMFEGYGPGGAAVLVMVATDNRNRTVSEIRHMFSKNGGNLGEQGSVAWMFERKSQIVIDGEKATEDQLMNAGARCRRRRSAQRGRQLGSDLRARSARRGAARRFRRPGSRPNRPKSRMVPKNLMKLEGKNASGMLRLSEALEEHDDVQNVYSNFDVDEKEMEALLGVLPKVPPGMRVLGIDCGTERTGWGVIDSDGRTHRVLALGVIRTAPSNLSADAWLAIAQACEASGESSAGCGRGRRSLLLRNVKDRAETGARPRRRAAGHRRGRITLGEYSPLEVKISVVGYGRAEKQQVQLMVRMLCRISGVIESDDASDALAVAICHATTCRHRSVQWEWLADYEDVWLLVAFAGMAAAADVPRISYTKSSRIDPAYMATSPSTGTARSPIRETKDEEPEMFQMEPDCRRSHLRLWPISWDHFNHPLRKRPEGRQDRRQNVPLGERRGIERSQVQLFAG